MEELTYVFIIIIIVLSLLVISNTYNIYTLSKKEFQMRSLIDLKEFDTIHPMIKELYHEAIVNGVFFLHNIIVNDVIKMNDIDKWYNTNKTDLFELIESVRELGKISIEQRNKKLDSSYLSNLFNLDIPELTTKIKALSDSPDLKESDLEEVMEVI
jgi:hypothetical protein